MRQAFSFIAILFCRLLFYYVLSWLQKKIEIWYWMHF